MSQPTPGIAIGPASARRTAADQHRVLLARIGEERFAFPLVDLLEAVDAPEVTPLVLAPNGVVGQCVHRGRLLAVFDGGALVGVPRTGGAGALLVVSGAEPGFGLWVDDVEDMVFAPRRAWRALPTDGIRVGSVLRALLALDDGLAALVDMESVRATVAARLNPGAR